MDVGIGNRHANYDSIWHLSVATRIFAHDVMLYLALLSIVKN